MILRALFFAVLVAVLLPHAPDLGLGGKAAKTPSLGEISALIEAAAPQQACADHAADCVSARAASGDVEGFLLKRLAQVRADLDAARKAREARAG